MSCNESRAPERFVLRSTVTSPYGRKVRIAIDVLGLAGRVSVQAADPRDASDSLRVQNPLGKMPCLLRADGEAIYDSRVIIEFLQEVAGTDRLVPARGIDRYRTLTRAALADGILDAALLIVYEGRFRAPEARTEPWLDYQRDKIRRALDAFERVPPDPRRTDAASIGLACALAYLDWRAPLEWRPEHPPLARWLDAFGAAEPAFARTAAAAT